MSNQFKRHILKRYVSLLEVLIALVLTIAVLMTLTFFYRQVTEIGSEVDRTGAKNFNMRYIESRLSAILPKAVSETDKKNDFLFFSIGDEGLTKPGSQSLIFTFDNQVSLDKIFSNHVLARIYLDKNENLMIAYWPSPKRWEYNQEQPPMKKEVLLQGVEDLSFEFYVAPQKNKPTNAEATNSKGKESSVNNKSSDDEKKVEPEPKGDWRRQSWLQEYKQLPVMVKIIVKIPNQQEPLLFIYPLANAKSHVTYE